MVHEISKTNSVFNQFIAEIRNKDIQADPLRFRKNLERMGEIMGYELSKTLQYELTKVQTPLGIAEVFQLKKQPVIASILRAGLTLHTGLLGIFDRAENAFISAYREEKNGGQLKVHVEYLASPDLNGKTLIIADPMLATGQSMTLVYEAIQRNGSPEKIHVVSAVASKQAIDFVEKILPSNAEIWVGVVDPELNDQAYIVPGIGDAGDLAFGLKL
ncbi:MAG: uracil phosphoribosyltransferase [Crocinitomicaceae bacterium]|nr:uracil phosphoribosyltransferase [Crocinitomicaceae bacterium]MBK8924481.1 uracil phosphoribosyltransferase [Crocinitomicaceae bacterium]